VAIEDPPERTSELAVSPTSDLLAAGTADGTFKLWRASDGRAVTVRQADHPGINHLTFSPDGTMLVSTDGAGSMKLWNTGDWKALPLTTAQRLALYPIFSPDGRHIAAGADDSVVLWDVQTGQETVLRGHAGPVYYLMFSPDSGHLLSADPGTSMKLWDTAFGLEVPLKEFLGAKRGTFSPNGKQLASAVPDGTIRVWDTASGQLINTHRGHEGPAGQPIYLAEGKQLFADGEDGTLKIWEATVEPERAFSFGNVNGIFQISVSPDGRRFAVPNGGAIVLLDADSGRESALEGARHTISRTDFSSDGKWLISHSYWNVGYQGNWESQIWDGVSGREVIPDGFAGASSAAFSADGQVLAAYFLDGTVRVWDAATMRLLKSETKHQTKVEDIALSPDGRLGISVDSHGVVKLWRTTDTQEISIVNPTTHGVERVTFTPDGRYAVAFFIGEARVFEAASGREKLVVSDLASSLHFALSSRHLVVESRKQKVRVFSLDTWREIALEGAGALQRADTLILSPSGKHLVGGEYGGAFNVWDLTDGRVLFRGETDAVPSLSPDGRYVTAGTASGTIHVWEVATGRETIINGSGGAGGSLAYTSDGKRLFSGGEDAVKIWDLDTGQELVTLGGHTGSVERLFLARGGRRLISFTRKGEIKLWDAATLARVLTQSGL
jgi:WD40 repeat protein